jgi:uncharacterized protein GlcG (DUF336 family)
MPSRLHSRQLKAAVIAIADQQGELIALIRHDGAPYPSIVIAANKAWTAARERKPSMEVGHTSREKDAGFDIGSFGDPRYTAFGGGLPVFSDGAVVGAIAVSGLSNGRGQPLRDSRGRRLARSTKLKDAMMGISSVFVAFAVRLLLD